MIEFNNGKFNVEEILHHIVFGEHPTFDLTYYNLDIGHGEGLCLSL